MTEESKQVPTPLTPEQAALAREGVGVDWFLQNLVSIANSSGMEVVLTLTVGGSIVSGRMISGKKYFDLFAMASGWPSDSSDLIRETYKKFGETYYTPQTGADDEKWSPPQYIHLQDAFVFSPDGAQLPSSSGILWRGKISAVAGFSLGSLSVKPN
jgi:hypothetical protein